FWEVHRHRMAPHIATQLQALLANGTVQQATGSITRALGASDRVVLDWRSRGSPPSAATPRSFDWVINCTGPAPSNSPEANPVVGSLLVHGWLARDPLSLGIITTPEGGARSADGALVPDLFIVGTLRKPGLWESTAVPELRQQAALVATQLVVQRR
ncbi:MAG: FAD/NAD(P)-binding protein, partial [Gemmataceae bacterium]